MKQKIPADSPLGRQSDYPSHYEPELLFPILRSLGREKLQLAQPDELPFEGVDLWTAYELSWLNLKGKPEVALAELRVPCESPNIIESKSLKLYFNSFNQTKHKSLQEVNAIIETDLSRCAGIPVSVKIGPVTAVNYLGEGLPDYLCIDHLDIAVTRYSPDATLLQSDEQSTRTERLVSHLFKSNCPVTGQPDWASLFIDYAGPGIDHAGLLQYLVSYRGHMGFHEQCVEQIFVDLMAKCRPEKLTVNARFLRRGGLDINPVRSTEKEYPLVGRLLRQ